MNGLLTYKIYIWKNIHIILERFTSTSPDINYLPIPQDLFIKFYDVITML